jgi:hypothetical protein
VGGKTVAGPPYTAASAEASAAVVVVEEDTDTAGADAVGDREAYWVAYWVAYWEDFAGCRWLVEAYMRIH